MPIDDDYTLDEGVEMPAAWWRIAGRIPLTVRLRTSHIPGLPLLAYGPQFSGGVLSFYGPHYLDLSHFTHWDAYRPQDTSLQRRAFDALHAAHPDMFSTVIGRTGPDAVWLALRLTRLNETIADTILRVHDQTCPTQEHLWYEPTA
jgi:hypothetical protein